MLYSIASATPRNVESYSVNTLLPENIRSTSEQLITFLEQYYNYLNSPNAPTLELNNVLHDKDLDNVSLKYLDAIQGLIAQNVPNSRVLDRVSLYKIIVRYYNSRGSEDNIKTMFKLLYDEDATITYPKENLFELSTIPEKSWPSEKSKIQDGYFWQNFSYVVKSSLDSSIWQDAFNLFCHPAGLKMFYSLAINLFSSNDVGNQKEFNISIINDSTAWIKDLFVSKPAQHSPRYQPGWIRESIRKYLFYANSYAAQTNKAFFYLIALRLAVASAKNSRDSNVHYSYDNHAIKFLDETVLRDSGLLNITIADASESYNDNSWNFSNLGVYTNIRPTSVHALTSGGNVITYNGAVVTTNQ